MSRPPVSPDLVYLGSAPAKQSFTAAPMLPRPSRPQTDYNANSQQFYFKQSQVPPMPAGQQSFMLPSGQFPLPKFYHPSAPGMQQLNPPLYPPLSAEDQEKKEKREMEYDYQCKMKYDEVFQEARRQLGHRRTAEIVVGNYSEWRNKGMLPGFYVVTAGNMMWVPVPAGPGHSLPAASLPRMSPKERRAAKKDAARASNRADVPKPSVPGPPQEVPDFNDFETSLPSNSSSFLSLAFPTPPNPFPAVQKAPEQAFAAAQQAPGQAFPAMQQVPEQAFTQKASEQSGLTVAVGRESVVNEELFNCPETSDFDGSLFPAQEEVTISATQAMPSADQDAHIDPWVKAPFVDPDPPSFGLFGEGYQQGTESMLDFDFFGEASSQDFTPLSSDEKLAAALKEEIRRMG